jgi:uncharacterized protein (DUF2141 family)
MIPFSETRDRLHTLRVNYLVLMAGLALASPYTPLNAAGPELGTVGASCRADEQGPAITVAVQGLEDRTGSLRLELYPANKTDFLADDGKLIGAGKVFRRVVRPTPVSGAVKLCIRAPAPGAYAILLVHKRANNSDFSASHDGVGVPGNPTTLYGSPSLQQARVEIGSGVAHATIRLMYRRGLFSFGPMRS